MTTMPTLQGIMKRGFVDTPDGQVHYYIGGEGEPLLLLHETPRSSMQFVNVLPILVKKARVIALDTIGYGDSDKPPRPYSIEDYAKSTIMFLDALGIKKISVVGYHTGAYVGIEMAAAYPERVDKLILDGAFNLDAEERQRLDIQWPEIELKEDGSHLEKEWKTCLKLGDLRLAHQRMLDVLKTGETMRYGWWAVMKYHQDERLPLVQSPTLLIWGLKDLQLVDSMGMRASEGRPKVENAIRRCKVVEVPEGGPFFTLDMPEEFGRLILEFLEAPGV